jgi:hypothetical protein
MEDELIADDELAKKVVDAFRAYGPILENGLSFLAEVAIRMEGFRIVFRPNESQHRGRPHCLIEMRPKSATFDIKSGELLAGDISPWNRTAEKVVSENTAELMKLWNKTRPDDQKLN